MTFKLKHQIPIAVLSGDTATHLRLEINGESVLEKTFDASFLVDATLQFDYDYHSGARNKMSFKWTGSAEHEKKSFSIKQININDQMINLYNAEYFPEINDAWWNGLKDEQKQEYNKIIYGKAGDTFGWYGEINFYFCTGIDLKCKHKFNKNNRDARKLLNEQNDWIFLDKNDSRVYHKVNK